MRGWLGSNEVSPQSTAFSGGSLRSTPATPTSHVQDLELLNLPNTRLPECRFGPCPAGPCAAGSLHALKPRTHPYSLNQPE